MYLSGSMCRVCYLCMICCRYGISWLSPVRWYAVYAVYACIAVYHAVGLAAYDIYEEVDFDKWLQERLLNEFTNTHPK